MIYIRKYDTALQKDYLGKILLDDLGFALTTSYFLPKVIYVSQFFDNPDYHHRLSLQATLDAIQSDEIIVVLPGTYAGHFVVTKATQIYFTEGTVLVSNSTNEVLRIEADVKIEGSLEINYTGIVPDYCVLRVVGRANSFIQLSKIDALIGTVNYENSGENMLKADKLITKIVTTDSANLYIHTTLIYDINSTMSSFVDLSCRTFRQILVDGSSKVRLDFFDNIEITDLPILQNILVRGGYCEVKNGTIRTTVRTAIYPVSVLSGKLRLRDTFINQKDSYVNMNCLSISTGATAILDNATLTNDGGITGYTITGSGTLKNYGSVVNNAIAPAYIWGTNYLINLLTINSLVE